ncbi:MAG: RNA 2',3'-cyclic phosphodiesterase [Myxococcota bacterium]|nr:RNA 2',3'-cyclic phosphodiesterase [Myxococcota bacterium]
MRLFLAIHIPQPQRAAAMEAQREFLHAARRLRIPLSPVPPENFHLTVLFLGELSALFPGGGERLDLLVNTCAAAAVKIPPLDLRLSGFGAFPGRRRPAVFWLGVECDRELARLYRNIPLEELRKAGAMLREEKEFVPHLTIARARKQIVLRTWPEELTGLDSFRSGVWRAGELTLYRSHSGSGGVRYEALFRWPSGAGNHRENKPSG